MGIFTEVFHPQLHFDLKLYTSGVTHFWRLSHELWSERWSAETTLTNLCKLLCVAMVTKTGRNSVVGVKRLHGKLTVVIIIIEMHMNNSLYDCLTTFFLRYVNNFKKWDIIYDSSCVKQTSNKSLNMLTKSNITYSFLICWQSISKHQEHNSQILRTEIHEAFWL